MVEVQECLSIVLTKKKNVIKLIGTIRPSYDNYYQFIIVLIPGTEVVRGESGPRLSPRAFAGGLNLQLPKKRGLVGLGL
jgi:hypothetical protein